MKTNIAWARYSPLLVVAAAFPVLGVVLGLDYRADLLVTGAIMAIAGIGLDVAIRGAGLMVFSAPAFMLVGAIATSKVTTAVEPIGGSHWSSLVGIAFGLVVSLFLASLLSLVTLRLSGLGLGLVTLFLLFAIATVVLNTESLGGTAGISGVPSFQVGPKVFGTSEDLLLLLGCVLLVLMVASRRYLDSAVGRELAATRDDEVAAAASGVPVSRRKIEAFILGCLFASVAGSFLAHQLHYTSATIFTAALLLDLLLMLYVGGIGTIWGVVLGAPLVGLATDYLNRVGQWGLAAKGVAFVLLLVLFPGGIAALIAAGRQLVRRMRGADAVAGGHHVVVRDRAESQQHEPATSPEPKSSSDVILELADIRMVFGGLSAVDGVSAQVKTGSTMALLGPNGAGKTTLFNVISGVLEPTSGVVRLDGEDVTDVSSSSMARSGVGRTFQIVRLFRGLSVYENVLVGTGAANHLGIGSAWRPGRGAAGAATALEACERFGLQHHLHERVDGLPIGLQRRVEMARAVARKPRLLLLDEPASGLSSPERDELSATLQELSGDLTMIIVEHDIAFVRNLADRGLVLDHGVPLFEGPMVDLLEDRDVISAYLGDSLGGKS